MTDNSRSQVGRDHQQDRNQESDRSRNDSRQNTSSSEIEREEALDSGTERRDRLSKNAPDNYERDAE